VLTREADRRQADLAKVAEALDLAGAFAGLVQGGKQDADQQSDDPDDNQELNQRESALADRSG
jgi:hypothetical protein